MTVLVSATVSVLSCIKSRIIEFAYCHWHPRPNITQLHSLLSWSITCDDEAFIISLHRQGVSGFTV